MILKLDLYKHSFSFDKFILQKSINFNFSLHIKCKNDGETYSLSYNNQ